MNEEKGKGEIGVRKGEGRGVDRGRKEGDEFLPIALLLMQHTCSNTDTIMIFSSTVLYFGDTYMYMVG